MRMRVIAVGASRSRVTILLELVRETPYSRIVNTTQDTNTIREILETKLFALMEPGAHGGPDHLREWIRSLDADELVEMFGTMMHAGGHKAASNRDSERAIGCMLRGEDPAAPSMADR
jgi:hypothetical protein